MKDWQRFVLEHGWRAHAYELAAVLGRTLAEIESVRWPGCKKLKQPKRFAELFTLWNARPPRDGEWPSPHRMGAAGAYEWQSREDALLGTLVGRFDTQEIAAVLTKRLRKLTGDRRAKRTRASIMVRMQAIGLQTSDVIGGISLSQAAKETGAYYNIWNAIKRGELRSFRIGKHIVIPHGAWAKWKASRVFPPKGFVQLSTLKRPLGIRSDKLSEWARMGYVPTAVRCNPYGTRAKMTRFGTWYIDPAFARKLIADRRAGLAMPWWGKPEPGNLKITWRLLEQRKHPASCATCRQIWGPMGAPRSYEDYAGRYPALDFGAKRHLTRKWSPGMTLAEVGKYTKRSWTWVRRAIDNGTLSAEKVGRCYYVQRAAATHWKARGCPAGSHDSSWVSIAEACRHHEFTRQELERLIAAGKLLTKNGTNGPMRGITYVPRHQVRTLRQTMGFSEEEAARRVGVRVGRLRVLLKGIGWRCAGAIPLDTVNALIRRRYSQDGGVSIAEAARELQVDEAWIHERLLDGTIRILRGKWNRRRLYITQPMMQRLREAKRRPPRRERFGSGWLFISQAALDAGVSTGTILRWAADGDLKRRNSHLGWRYARWSLRSRARQYWKRPRLIRATPPNWLHP